MLLEMGWNKLNRQNTHTKINEMYEIKYNIIS